MPKRKWMNMAVFSLISVTGMAFSACGDDTVDPCTTGNLQCVDPVNPIACSDQYCYYPPPAAMSQASCCRRFGNVGSLNEESFEINNY